MRQLIKPENTMQKTSFRKHRVERFSTQQVTRQRKERQPKTVILFNKPYDVLPQFTDEAGRSTLKDFIPVAGVYAAGRLDRDSEGLLVLTNDGALQAKLTQPGKRTGKIYYVQVEGEPTPEALTALRDGVRGKDKLDVPIKMVWNYAGNCLINQHSEINRTHEILQDDKKCELIVVIDCHMTSSAKYADILLPDCTASEQMDFALDASCGNMSYVIFNDQVIKPRFECKTIYEMTSELAKRLGVEQQFTEGRTQEEWLRHLYEQSRAALPELPEFDEFRKQGIFKKRDPQGHHVAYRDFRNDPQANPLTTPSGKIEIYSQQLAEIASTWELPEGDVIDPLPIYTPGFESLNDPLVEKFPLQLTGFHYKSRVHSTYGNVDVLKAACRQEMWINPIDARKRGIANGDRIRIFNDRGEVHIEAKVTPRMMPGVVALGEGAWYNPDASRVDQAGSINVLTTQRPSPLAKGNPSHTNLVQVEKL